MMNKSNGVRSLRNPWTIAGKRLFGDLLPFIGFETMEAPIKELKSEHELDTTEDTVRGDFFTMEWLGYGLSLGGFRVRIKR